MVKLLLKSQYHHLYEGIWTIKLSTHSNIILVIGDGLHSCVFLSRCITVVFHCHNTSLQLSSLVTIYHCMSSLVTICQSHQNFSSHQLQEKLLPALCKSDVAVRSILEGNPFKYDLRTTFLDYSYKMVYCSVVTRQVTVAVICVMKQEPTMICLSWFVENPSGMGL